jgi:hypothetical protein
MKIDGGLGIQIEDGKIFLIFVVRNGDEVAIDVEHLADLSDDQVRHALTAWCHDRRNEATRGRLAGLKSAIG